MKKVITALFIVLISFNCYSQQNDSTECMTPVDFGVDLYSRFVWRGLELNNAPNIQPWITLAWKGFSLTTWGSYATSKNFTEVDLTLSYETSNLTLSINDYFNPFIDTTWNNYFDWKSSSTTHALEFMTSYKLPIEKIPLELSLGIYFYGNDKNSSGKNYYSAYFEARYPFSVKKNELCMFAGASLNEGNYSEKPAFINVGLNILRKIEITDSFDVPLNISFVVNPDTEAVFLVAGVCF